MTQGTTCHPDSAKCGTNRYSPTRKLSLLVHLTPPTHPATSFQPDGSLAEFVLMERFYDKIESLGSNDPWWCHLNTAEGIRNFFPDLPHDIR